MFIHHDIEDSIRWWETSMTKEGIELLVERGGAVYATEEEIFLIGL